ncbi:MAG: sodium-translocating pyrophosphatase [Candidatus Ranarchaeia archaeon]
MPLFQTFFELPSVSQLATVGVLATAITSLIYAWRLRRKILRFDTGSERMKSVWEDIRDGANAYLDRQLRTILPIMIVLAVVLFLSIYVIPPSLEAKRVFPELSEASIRVLFAVGRAVAFLMGAGFSLLVGQLGMRIAIQSSIRVTTAAKDSYNKAFSIAYQGGAFTGMLTNGLGLLGGTLIFIMFGVAAPDALLGFGFGGTLLALFMRVGGGIYTKAADIGADLVGKIEQNLPEDDPRNAAVIADLVGDNVGDCAGMAADIFESYEVTIVSALILGLALYLVTGDFYWIIFPLIVRAFGVIASLIGTIIIPYWKNISAEKAMYNSYWLSSAITISLALLFAWLNVGDIRLGLLIVVGVVLSVIFNALIGYFTSTSKRPVKEIVDSTQGGAATTILAGLSLGYESGVWATVVIVITFVIAYIIAPNFVLYGIALIGIGMLSLTGNNVAMDSYGPISDNAGGIAEMVDEPPKVKSILAELDAVGNTTKAITKGLAIASASIAAVSLFASFIADISLVTNSLGVSNPIQYGIRINDPIVFSGLLLGAALPWLFSALAIRSVSYAAMLIVNEVRAQFRIPGILDGERKPDYQKVVRISTFAAQKELLPLAIISITIPLVVGLLLQVEALGAFLAGTIASGQILAVFMSNAGGAWDNAKKIIENEPVRLDENMGKGSDRHRASVIGDTVGDPLKDTSGPALNPMIKVVNLVTLIAAPILVHFNMVFSPNIVTVEEAILASVILLGLIAWALGVSKRKRFEFPITSYKEVDEDSSGTLAEIESR